MDIRNLSESEYAELKRQRRRGKGAQEGMTGTTLRPNDSDKTELTGRKTRMGDFGKQEFSLHYAGWNDEWIVRNDETGHDMGRFTGTEIMNSGLLLPKRRNR